MSTARRAASGASRCVRDARKIGARDDAAIEAAHRLRDFSPSTSMRRPRGGRLLMIVNTIPRAFSSATASRVARRQRLVVGDQCAVDIGDDGGNLDARSRRSGVMTTFRGRIVDRTPAPAVARQQLVGFARARASGRHRSAVRRVAILRPGIEDRLHHPPSGLDVVGALEQRRVADHAVVDQRLVAGVRRRP